MTTVGFTGTRSGMTEAQKEQVMKLLGFFEGEVVGLHGDCIGVVEKFFESAKKDVVA